MNKTQKVEKQINAKQKEWKEKHFKGMRMKGKKHDRQQLAEFYLNLSKPTLSDFDKNAEEAEKDIDDLDRQVNEALKLLTSQQVYQDLRTKVSQKSEELTETDSPTL